MLVVNEIGQVAAVIENHVERFAIGPIERLLHAPVELLSRLPFPREDRDAIRRNRRRRMILGGENIAGAPAHFGAEIDQGLDENRRLDGHVQAAANAGALERFLALVFFAQSHEAGHLELGDVNFLAAKISEADIGDFIIGFLVRLRCSSCHRCEFLWCFALEPSGPRCQEARRLKFE